ncbi:MAG: lysophospholipid acyltransferase family protein [Gemmataceae bacterium]
MKIRHPWLIRLIGFLAALAIRLWMSTLRYRTYLPDGTPHPTDPKKERFLYAFWHESILYPTLTRTKIYILISHHADGEMIARACHHLGFGVVRGSTTRGGTKALMQLISISSRSHLMVTPDGPRGPRRKVQLGLVFLASITGLPIVPVGVGYSSAWRAKSWDRFALPRPWSTAYGVAGEPIHIPKKMNRETLERYRDLVEQRMLETTRIAEEWASGNPQRGKKSPPTTVRAA